VNKKRVTLTQKEFEVLVSNAHPETCSGCALLLEALKTYTRNPAGRKSSGQAVSVKDRVRAYRERKRTRSKE